MAEATTVGDVLESADKTVGDLIDDIKELGPEIWEWFRTGWNHLINLEWTELTLDQAGFTVFIVLYLLIQLLAQLGSKY